METLFKTTAFTPSVAPFPSYETGALTDVEDALIESYETDGGINHLEGANLPSSESVDWLCSDFMHLLFPGFFEQCLAPKREVLASVRKRLAEVHTRLADEIAKSLRFTCHPTPVQTSREQSRVLLKTLPELRRKLRTDVMAAYSGDPAARSIEEIILSYPCVLAISLQRIAHVLHGLKVPLIPRMLTEYAHERTGCDIHPGAQIGSHFFIDHCTGVVIGETARIGSHVKLYQGVTLGAKSFEVDSEGNPVKGVKRHPDIGDHVTIYAHATILGGDTVVGAHSIIGANVWLLSSVPENSLAYYNGEGLAVCNRRSRKSTVEKINPQELFELDWQI
jgi:serine O-acetyltransferase